MDRHRLLELAVEELERQKAGVEAEIETVRAQLRGSGIPRKAKPVASRIAKRRSRTRAQRKAQGQRMREYWAAKRSKAAKVKKTIPPNPKPGKTAVSKAISDAMRAYWAKRKAKAAGKTAKAKPPQSKVAPKSSHA